MTDPERVTYAYACRNCRRPLYWLPGVGWLHGELPQYAHESSSCNRAEPVCDGNVPHCETRHIAFGPEEGCHCTCHRKKPRRNVS
jgi:hypothetical protein